MKSVSIGCLGSAMLTRRTATVTISAPDASTAAAFSSKLLYLPVPTISREVNVRPATLQLSATSAASDEMDDLEPVAVLDSRLVQGRAGDDGEVALDRHLRRLDAEPAQHAGDGQTGGDAVRIAVDGDCHSGLRVQNSFVPSEVEGRTFFVRV